MNVQTLTNKLTTALTGLLGIYKYTNGFTRPAIAVGESPPGVTVSGLEVILPIMPDSSGQWLSNEIYRKDTWDIVLVQREGCSADTFQKACDRLTRFFYNSHTTYIPQNKTVGSYNQLVLTYRHQDLYSTFRS